VQATLVGEIWGIRPKKKGIFDLTQVRQIMSTYVENRRYVSNTEHIDYISIPGEYFHPERGVLEHNLADIWKVAFAGVDVGLDLLPGYLPLLSVKLKRPHDGIVEESSNNLIPEESGRRSEKRRSIYHELDTATRISYAHLVPKSAEALVHTAVPDDGMVIDLVASIIASDTLESWLHNKLSYFVHQLDRVRLKQPQIDRVDRVLIADKFKTSNC
jgi:hypothetical protein